MSELNQKLDVFGIFSQVRQTFAESEEKAQKEQNMPKIDRYRISEDGDYTIRVLPLAPELDENGQPKEMKRKGYEWPLRQLFLKIEKPAKKGKKSSISVPVIKTTDKEVGFSVDIIDKYVEIAKQYDDEEINEQLEKTSYYGGLKWQSLRCMYVFDKKKNERKPLLFQASFAQYKELDDAKRNVWKKLRAKSGGEEQNCPISDFSAYPVDITRKKNGTKTEYKFTIDTLSDPDQLTEQDLNTLLAAPRIDSIIYRYTRYHLEATLVFLKQMDEKFDIDVCQQPDFIEAVEKLKGELSPDDKSHFDIETAGEKSDGNGGEVTIDSLWAEYDALAEQDLDSSSREYKDLRDKIQQFIVDNDLDVRITHGKNNDVLLNEVEDALVEGRTNGKANENAGQQADSKPEPKKDPEPEPAPEPQPARRRRSMGAAAPDPDQEPENKPDSDQEPEPEPENKAADPEPEAQPVRRRRRI